jgi:hypothetical protein
MLYIQTKLQNYSFHIGDWHIKGLAGNSRDPIVSIQADGDELDHILNHFNNIPKVDKNVVIYYGEIAQFIIGNW